MNKFVLIFVAAVAASCSSGGNPEGYSYTWTKHVMDGHLTGVTAATADNVEEAMGTVSDGVYTAPNGRVFSCGSTPAVANDMLEVQPRMAALKEVIGWCEQNMSARAPESALSNWEVDTIMEETEKLTGKKVDLGFANFGGIRTSFSKGPVLMDDLVSMFPFKNYLCYVRLSGRDVRRIFERFAKSGHVQVVGGVEFVVKDHKIKTLLIGGKPLDDNKEYGVATIDFLLDGGDGMNIAQNARELIQTEVKVFDALLPAVRKFAEEGKPISYHTDGRVQILDFKEIH